MRLNGLGQILDGRLHRHGRNCIANQVRGMLAHDVNAQYFTIIRIRDYFGKSGDIAHGLCGATGTIGEFADLYTTAGSAGLFFAQPHRPDLGKAPYAAGDDVDRTEEMGRFARVRIKVELPYVVVLPEPAVEENAYPVGYSKRLHQVVGNGDGGNTEPFLGIADELSGFEFQIPL